MFTPEEQQVEICLLKSDLEAIGDELIVQRSALPALDAENEQKYRETMSVLKNVRSLNKEIERLKLDNVKLTAQRVQLKRQSDELSESLEASRDERTKLTESLKHEEQEIEMLIRKYEDALQEKAERFRKTHGYYNEEEINTELDKVNNIIAKLKDGMSKKQSSVDGLKTQMDALHPEIPENLLEQIGKLELEEEVKSLTEKYEEFEEKRFLLMKPN